MTDRLKELCRATLFGDLDDEALDRVTGLMTGFDAPAGQVLMRSGDAGAGLLLLEEGSVIVSLRTSEVELGPGECVGELALLSDKGEHVARVRAKTDIRGYAVDRGHFDQMLESEPRVALALLRVVARRLSDVLER